MAQLVIQKGSSWDTAYKSAQQQGLILTKRQKTNGAYICFTRKTMHKEIITLHELAANLDKAINSNVGMHGLRILLYGWMKKTQLVDNKILNDRKQVRGEQYLTAHEALSFSKYAGYDLLN